MATEFVFMFDETCPNWSRNEGYNEIFLRVSQNYFNHCLQTNGFFFLNEALLQLGLPRTSDGQVMGWIFTEEEPGHVDFKFSDNGNNTFQLLFNVEGSPVPMIDKLA